MESPSPHIIHDASGFARTADCSYIRARASTAEKQWPASCSDLSLPSLVSLRARETPEALAIACATEHLSYAELDARSSLLARHLRSVGVGRDVAVAVCLKRSVAFCVSALAVMKAGGAYVPMDPSLPKDRLAFLIKDTVANLVIAEQGYARELSNQCSNVLSVTPEGNLAEEVPVSGPDVIKVQPEDLIEVKPEDLAYVIYTSGSTGQPKGVEIIHRGLSNLIAWHCAAFDVTSADRASHLAGIGFDAAAWELWPYLTAGASVHIGDDIVSKDPEGLRNWLLENSVTVCFAAAPLAERLMALEWPAQTHLRILLTGADTLHRHPPPRVPFRVVNNYGPTECTVVATSMVVPPSENSGGRPSIGRPIANTRIYILDENRKPVPEGDAGEIWISGSGVARGYRSRPELTAAKFHPDPFDSAPSTRMYGTGDLGRMLPDGEILFLGRMDDQVKIRGFRIEPGEIESILNEHPDVLQSAVAACAFDPDDVRLVAHLVLKSDRMPSSKEFQQFLGSRLPQLMIPSAFVQLEELPRTSSGKVDRRALSWFNPVDALPDDQHAEPLTAVEERLTQIVTQLLKRERVHRKDNFFLLGGHSLLGTQLIARARDAFGVELSLRFLFDSPTVAALATEVERLIRARVLAMSDGEVYRILAQARVSGPSGNGG